MIDALARIWVLPLWSGPVDPKPLKGGLSNLSFTVEDAGKTYVVRFGRDYPFHHVFRAREVMTARAAHKAGFAPEVLHVAPGVLVSQYVPGTTYAADDVRANIGRIAGLMRQFHNEMPRHVSGPAFLFWPFHVIRDYARTLEAGGSRKRDQLQRYIAVAEELEAAQPPMPIIFAHNDFLPANIIDDGRRLWLIDFEYAGFSTAMFDLANLSSNSGFSEEESDIMLAAYFGRAPDLAVKRSLAAMQSTSLLREAMWSMISELHLDLEGVDYEAYTELNLERFERALDAYRSRYGRAAA